MSDRSRLRLVLLQVMVASLLVTLFGRLWFLQVAAGSDYQQAAADNRIREVITPAVRGQILDDQGRPLVDNRTSLVVTADRAVLTRLPHHGQAVLERLAKVLHLRYAEVKQRVTLCGPKVPKPCWNGSPYQPIPVAEDAGTAQALQIMERREDFPGVTAEPQAVREYPKPEGANAAHLLGYLSPVTDAELARQAAGRRSGDVELRRTDQVGRAGLEQVYDEALRGRNGVLQVAVDHLGRVAGTAGETPPTPGNHVVTSIDAKLQAVTEAQLAAAIARARGQYDKITHQNYKGDSGAAVVLDVKTGRVLAMASYPSYDPSVWVGGISSSQFAALTSDSAGVPLISRAFQGQFAPGSTFKVVSTAAAAAAGYSLRTDYDCPQSFDVGNRTFTNFESESFGPISMKRAIEVSCDTVWYKIAYQQWLADGGVVAKRPKDVFVSMAKAFKLGQPTGIDLPAESPGLVVDRDYKKKAWQRHKAVWCQRAKSGYTRLARTNPGRAAFLQALDRENCADYWQYRAGDAVNFAIGQGDTLLTPLQLARSYAAVANGGTLWRPELAKAVLSPTGKVVSTIKPHADGHLPASSKTLDFLHDALRGVTEEGTAAPAFAGFPLDKIPVASKTGTAEVANKQTTSWFASYAPANDPQYAVVMMVTQGGTGLGTSAPSVRKIYEALFGVNGSTVDPRTSVLPGGVPPVALPKIRPDGTVVGPAGGSAARSGGRR